MDQNIGISLYQHDQFKLQSLFKNGLPELKQLNICNITYNTLNVICENSKKLKSLFLSELQTINCIPIYEHLTQLEHLYIAFQMDECLLPWIKYYEYANNMNYKFDILNLKNLEILRFTAYVPGLTPNLVRKLPKIKGYSELIHMDREVEPELHLDCITILPHNCDFRWFSGITNKHKYNIQPECDYILEDYYFKVSKSFLRFVDNEIFIKINI